MWGELGRTIGKVGLATTLVFSSADCVNVQSPSSADSTSSSTSGQSKEIASTPETRAINFGKKIIQMGIDGNIQGMANAVDPDFVKAYGQKNLTLLLTVTMNNYKSCQNNGHPVQLDSPKIVSSGPDKTGGYVTSLNFPYEGGQCRGQGLGPNGGTVSTTLYWTNLLITEKGGKELLSLIS